MSNYNFYAGPSILPKEVMQEASKATVSFDNYGLSILEISHRGAAYTAVLEEAESNVRELLNIPDSYAVLFLTGGASTQFFMTAMNILQNAGAYVDTGAWSKKAIKEANKFGRVDVVASSEDKNYNYIPKEFTLQADTEYLHITSNNTIFGTQYHNWPDVDVPMICDMSSDIMSRPLPLDKFGVIYAGAQKNFGPAGTTLVIIRKDMLGKVNRDIPTMLDYNTHIAKGSAFNTPPTFPIYVAMLVSRWLIKNGGLNAMEKRNQEKAKILYDAIDTSPYFYGTTELEDRSLMNVTFKMHEEEYTAAFIKTAEENACIGLKGHRSVGGLRASIYNAMPKAGVECLADLISNYKG